MAAEPHPVFASGVDVTPGFRSVYTRKHGARISTLPSQTITRLLYVRCLTQSCFPQRRCFAPLWSLYPTDSLRSFHKPAQREPFTFPPKAANQHESHSRLHNLTFAASLLRLANPAANCATKWKLTPRDADAAPR